LERAIEVRIVNEPLPSDRRTRLFEVDPHDDLKAPFECLPEFNQSPGILKGRRWIMNAAWADDDQQPSIMPMKNPSHPLSRLVNRLRCPRRAGKLAHQMRRRREFVDSGYSEVVGLVLFQDIHVG
jgi:hypothetical protein